MVAGRLLYGWSVIGEWLVNGWFVVGSWLVGGWLVDDLLMVGWTGWAVAGGSLLASGLWLVGG